MHSTTTPTHQAGAFALISEEGIAKGVRRIVAFTAADAKAAILEGERLAAEVAEVGKLPDASPDFERRVNELKGLVGGTGSAHVWASWASTFLHALKWLLKPSTTRLVLRACLACLASALNPQASLRRGHMGRGTRPCVRYIRAPATHVSCPAKQAPPRRHHPPVKHAQPGQTRAPRQVDVAVIPAAAKAAIREDVAALARRVLEAQRVAAAAAKERATEEALAAADEAAAKGARHVVRRIDVGTDPKVGGQGPPTVSRAGSRVEPGPPSHC
jgi:hypothetical protein